MERTPQTDWRAIIVDPSDPSGSMKAQVKVFGMMEGIPDEALPWAEFLLPIGYKYTPVNKGDLVWVDFPYGGDTRRPRIIGAAMDWQADPNDPGSKKGQPNVAPEIGGKGNAYQPPTVTGQPAGPVITTANNTKARDEVISRNGILEVRSIGGGYSITNMAKHATIGFNEAGDIIISTSAGVFIHSDGDTTVDSGAAMHFKSAGEMTFEAGGAMKQEAASVSVEAQGSYSMEAGSASYKAGNHAFTK
ncbi:MAG: baseplate protein [Enterobacteriaceae bacterium]